MLHPPLFLPAVWRWDTVRRVTVVAALLAALAVAVPAASSASVSSPDLAALAARHPERTVEVVVQARGAAAGRALQARVRALGGRVTRRVTLIQAFGARLSASAAESLAHGSDAVSISLNGTIRPSGDELEGKRLETAYNQSIKSDKVWSKSTGRGVGVAVIDTGIAGGLADFRDVRTGVGSRVIASAVTNPDATDAEDHYGHGTHIAGLIAGNSLGRGLRDPLAFSYAGVAPEANLISIKASDDHGQSSVLDVLAGIQFAVDHRADYNIRVINLSLTATEAQSADVDPLDAAAEAAWFHGLVVVAAAGNRGAALDAVHYAPANDPFVITVGGVDDRGTKDVKDDVVSSWSSRGLTQAGLVKPDVLVPGAHLASTLAPGSDFASLCPDCVRDGAYFQAGGTSMAAGVASGAVADLIAAHPDWSPNQVKGALVNTQRDVPGVGREVALDAAVGATGLKLVSNVGLAANTLIDTATGDVDPARASWTRASWTQASDLLRASWTRASWTCDCGTASGGEVDPTRASWTRASWTTSFEK